MFRKNHLYYLAFVVMVIINLQLAFGQHESFSTVDSLDKTFLNWHLGYVPGTYAGANVDEVYKLMTNTRAPKKKIVVAVIDSGVDTEHKDLQGRIWTNENEIPNNGIDDDLNGYIDDAHGWNFLGNAAGENIAYENYEFVRILKQYDSLFHNIETNDSIEPKQLEEYYTYLKCQKEFDEKLANYEGQKAMLSAFETRYNSDDSVLVDYLDKNDYTQSDVEAISSKITEVKAARKFMLTLYKRDFKRQDLVEYKNYVEKQLNLYLNKDIEPRKIIADNVEDITDKNYGNPDVKGTDAFHGTFVSGIICAVRNNHLGMDGIADSVLIMPIRAVPDGDERDKDVALAIYYAVDNGANIINMSFGKGFSPQKKLVDDAFRYAESHNVLLVHAAGNDADNLDTTPNFPSNYLLNGEIINNWITVGASDRNVGKLMCGEFSNYGKTSVDVFAPGVNIISTVPESRYAQGDGTSFASPVVSGIAALVWSYYPELTVSQLKEILLSSCTDYQKKKVILPNITTNDKQKTAFKNLSKTGGIVNAYGAMVKAESMLNALTLIPTVVLPKDKL